MIDKFSLTTFDIPDKDYLKEKGDVLEDGHRSNIYKYLCRLDKATILYYPHKFSEGVNANIPFTKIDINPKHFECFNHMDAYLCPVFDSSCLILEDFNVSRIDIAVDLQNFPADNLLSMIRMNRIRSSSLSFFKGTIYIGSNPKVRIYDKVKEIKARVRKGYKIEKYDKSLIKSDREYTRFEVQIRGINKSLKWVIENKESFASYFDRLEIFNFSDNEGMGVLQFLYKYINRKFRKEIEAYRDYRIVEEIKSKYIDWVSEWFNPDASPF